MKKILAVLFVGIGIILGLTTTPSNANNEDREDYEEREICNTGSGNCVTATIVSSCDSASCEEI